MYQSLRGGSEVSLEALANADLVFLDMESLVAPRAESYASRRGVGHFLRYYEKKDFVLSSVYARDRLHEQVQKLGWKEYISCTLGGSHLGTTHGKRMRILGRGRAHFRPLPKNLVFVGVDSELNQATCEYYTMPLITVPSLEKKEGFNFANLYLGEGFRGCLRRGRELLARPVF